MGDMGMNLDELERLHKAATPGEWGAPPASCYASVQEAKNACYIAALHNAFPALLELARDGERYRWLREQGHKACCELYIGVDSVKHPGMWALSTVDADAAIDAARKGERNGNS